MKRRYFNTAGPCIEGMHYMIPAEQRLPEAPELVARLGYFVVHAPRQTGKTTALRALARRLTAEGEVAALLFSCEDGQSWDENVGSAQRAVLADLQLSAQADLPVELRPPALELQGDEGIIGRFLSAWAAACPRPLVLFFDEIDALRGMSLITVLRQLRAGYRRRPEQFPASVALCGLHDVRDYKAASGGDPGRLGTASPFNIKLDSLRVGDFTPEEVRALYHQHTEATGQHFSDEAVADVVQFTAGQPWLVNGLAQQIVDKMAVPNDETIRPEHVAEAKERLIRARATHLDSLVEKLHESRVRSVMGPILAGSMSGSGDAYDDNLQYCRDLGLLATDNPIRMANPIYREIVVRLLSSSIEAKVLAEPLSFVQPDGRLAFERLLADFADFWREHGEVLAAGAPYHEVAPQLVLMAYLQRIVNGGGSIDREYGIGRGRIDLLVRWPYQDSTGKRVLQRQALELKVWRDKEKDPLAKGLTQLDGYLDRLNLPTGALVIFDRRSTADAIDKRTRFETAETPGGRSVTVLRG